MLTKLSTNLKIHLFETIVPIDKQKSIMQSISQSIL